MATMTEPLNEVAAITSRLKKQYPSETNAFMNLMNKAETGPALGGRKKELINVAISVAGQCEWCIAVHVKHTVTGGATRDEIVETGIMAVLMHGGPVLMFMTLLFKALDEFLPQKDD